MKTFSNLKKWISVQKVVKTVAYPPNHMLSILDDNCIEKIFGYFLQLEDLLSVAQVCRQFQKCAKNCFQTQFKCIYIDAEKSMLHYLTFNRAQEALRIFGHLIESLTFMSTRDAERDDLIFKLIARYCGKTLKELSVIECNPNFKHTRFHALEKLYFESASPQNFRLKSSLKYLRINADDFMSHEPWFVLKMPQLEQMEFVAANELTDDILTNFLTQNSQLKYLKVQHCTRLSSETIIQIISKCTPNLIKLNIFTQYLSDENLQNIVALKKLKSLNLCFSGSFEKLIKVFAENNTPIEELSINLKGDVHYQCGTMMALKTLKHLNIRTSNGEILDEVLCNVINTQSALETIHVKCWGIMTMSQIGKMVTYCKDLIKFSCDVNVFDVDLKDYESVLRIAKNGNNVNLKISCVELYDIPTNVLDSNQRWLSIIDLTTFWN